MAANTQRTDIDISNCPLAEELVEYLRGNLSDDKKDKLGEHILDCTYCMARLEILDPSGPSADLPNIKLGAKARKYFLPSENASKP